MTTPASSDTGAEQTTCPGCGWCVPPVPRCLPPGLALIALADHRVNDCPPGAALAALPVRLHLVGGR